MSTLLRLNHVTVFRNGIPLFEPLSFALNPGCALALKGRNGIGKTSLLEVLAGFNDDFDGKVSKALDPFYLPIKGPFEGDQTIQSNLIFWAKFWEKTTGTLQAITKQWHLDQLLQLPYDHLSQGQKQRVNLARLSLKASRLWLLDEPTLSLDARSISLFQRALKAHLSNGGAALIATHHDLELTQSVDLILHKEDTS